MLAGVIFATLLGVSLTGIFANDYYLARGQKELQKKID